MVCIDFSDAAIVVSALAALVPSGEAVGPICSSGLISGTTAFALILFL
jgi:hypothetical protein